MFGTADLGGITVSAKAGQYNVYWGVSPYSIDNSIAYSQGPVDTIKSATSPGAEAKELFLSLKQVSAQIQLSSEVSVAAQYSLDFDQCRKYVQPVTVRCAELDSHERLDFTKRCLIVSVGTDGLNVHVPQ